MLIIDLSIDIEMDGMDGSMDEDPRSAAYHLDIHHHTLHPYLMAFQFNE
jgi:hypothetical protein